MSGRAPLLRAGTRALALLRAEQQAAAPVTAWLAQQLPIAPEADAGSSCLHGAGSTAAWAAAPTGGAGHLWLYQTAVQSSLQAARQFHGGLELHTWRLPAGSRACQSAQLAGWQRRHKQQHGVGAAARRYHDQTKQQRPSPPSQNKQQQDKQAAHQEKQQQDKGQQPASGGALSSLPNLLSLSRVAAAPVISYLLATEQWGEAAALLAAAAATDWADGALARRLGHTSKLGSYLDPLSDKILVCSVVATLGVLGLLPAWLASLIVTRDAGQVAVTVGYRLSMFGWKWPGLAAFADVDNAPAPPQSGGISSTLTNSESSSSPGSETSSSSGSRDGSGAPAEMPRIQPLFVSKLNTALAFALAGGCVSQQWGGVPGAEALQALELAVGATTAASGLGYLWLYSQGRLLQR